MSKLDGKVAVVAGAARGIGAAATSLFAAEGAKLKLFHASDGASFCAGGVDMVDDGVFAGRA